jgi:hypothetical protein
MCVALYYAYTWTPFLGFVPGYCAWTEAPILGASKDIARAQGHTIAVSLDIARSQGHRCFCASLDIVRAQGHIFGASLDIAYAQVRFFLCVHGYCA